MKLDNLILQNYGGKIAVGWFGERSEILNWAVNFGLTNAKTPKTNGPTSYFIAKSLDAIIEALATFQVMHSIRINKRISIMHAREIAQKKLEKMTWRNFLGKDYSERQLSPHQQLSGDSGGCDDTDWRESYIEKCVIG